MSTSSFLYGRFPIQERLRFCPIEDVQQHVIRYATHPIQDKALASQVLSEATLRSWLGGMRYPWQYAEIPESLISSPLRDYIENLFSSPFDIPPASWISTQKGENYDYCSALNSALNAWRNADGFLILVTSVEKTERKEAILTPFRLTQRAHASDPFVVAADGQTEILGLRESWNAAATLAQQFGWINQGAHRQIQLPAMPAECANLPHGASATLPFLVALRVNQQGLKLLNPLSWTASGSPLSGSSGSDWQAKLAAVTLLSLPEHAKLLPDNGGKIPEAEIRGKVESLVNSLRSVAETPTLSSVRDKVQSIEESLKGRPDLLAEHEQLDRCRSIAAGYDSPIWNVLKYRIKKLLGDIYCHLGQAHLCLGILPQKEALSCAEDCDIAIRRAICYTDCADYKQARTLLLKVLEHPFETPRSEREVELPLKAKGSLGQTLMYQALESKDKKCITLARQTLDDAVNLAIALDKDAPNSSNPYAPRNATYLMLWYAYFSRQEVPELYNDWSHQAVSQTADHGLGWMHRAAHLANYRAILQDDSLPFPEYKALSLPDSTLHGGYPYATTLKYLATSQAYAGEIAEARKTFALASSALADTKDHPILQMIHASILVEAATCLLENVEQEALDYLNRAHGVLSTLATQRLINPDSPVAPVKWLRHIEALRKRQHTISPQIYYPY